MHGFTMLHIGGTVRPRATQFFIQGYPGLYMCSRVYRYPGYIGYIHMCYPGYTWLSLVYTLMVTTGYRLDMDIILGWLFMFTTGHGHPRYTWLLKITTSYI